MTGTSKVFSILPLLALTMFGSITSAGDSEPMAVRSSTIPQRENSALSGSQFLELTKNLNTAQREAAILNEIRRGNIPEFLRHLVPVSLFMVGEDGKQHQATIWVMPDYLAIGQDDDFIRIPMNPITAQAIAEEFGFTLPTTKLVDEIYSSAQTKLLPVSMQPGSQMASNHYYRNHNLAIESQIGDIGRTALTSGHKKDVVVSKKLIVNPGRVAIYGWHRESNRPIQPLSFVHTDDYADYSHGVRLVRNTMILDGKTVLVSDVLKDSILSTLVSNEGAFENITYR